MSQQSETSPATRSLGSRYRLEQVLGSGAMGQVWRAQDLRTGEAVAAKLLREELCADPQIVGRFVQERSILVELVHPHIVGVRDLVVDGGDLGIVMDLVDGEDLRRHLTTQGTLPAAEAVRISVDVLDALAAAHAKNVLHRDVKPDNVLLDRADPPFVRLTDFGIARLAQETTVRMTGVLGTAEYIAPEVFTAETVSAAADVYGAGVQLYELLAGRTPFAGGGTSYAIAYRHVTTPPPPIPGLPQPLARLLTDMLAKEPGERPSAAAAANALRGLAGQLAGVAALAPMPEPRWQDAASAPQSVDVKGGGQQVRDSQATSIKGDLNVAPAPPKPVSAPQVGAALAPEASATALGAQTSLQGPRVARPEVDVPDAPAAIGSRSRRRLYLTIAAVAVLVGGLAGGGFAIFGHGSKSGPKAVKGHIDLATASANLEQDPIGLTVDRSAAYDPSKKTYTVTLKYATSGQDVTLPAQRFLEMVPAQNGNVACPTITVAQGTLTRDTRAYTAGCGWDVAADAPISQSSPLTVSFTVPFALTQADTTAAVQTYIQAEADQTAKTLTTVPTGTDFAAQRLSDIEVNVTPGVIHQQLAVSVYPVWTAGSTPDSGQPLYTTATAGQTSALASQLGTIAGPSADSSCSDDVKIADDVATGLSAVSSCKLDFAVGALRVESGEFPITNLTGG